MSKINNIWEKYNKIEIIGSGKFGDVYKAKIGNQYVIIKKINKLKINKKQLLEVTEILKKIESDNLVKLIERIEIENSFYIINEFCHLNLQEYLNRRKEALSIEEIKELLIDLNKGFKVMNKNNIIHGDISLSNILLSLNKNNINKVCFKISDFGLSDINQEDFISINVLKGSCQFIPPECLKGKKINNKGDIWSLGILIYYLLFKQYPYNGTEIQILKQIESNKKLNVINDKLLDDLLKKMLNPNIDKRINWEEYFNHPFFNNNNVINNLPFFNMTCSQHSKNFYGYCSDCKCNICELCDHNSHNFIPFYQISFNQNEINQINNLSQLINNKLEQFIKIKKNIEELINKIKSIKGNSSIYEKDKNNNYKQYLIDYLEVLTKKIEINEDLININFAPIKKENNIKCEYDIKKGKDDKDNYLIQRIINSYEETKRNNSWLEEESPNNEKEIKDNCEMYLNNKKIDFSYKYKFPKDEKYKMQIFFKKPLSNTNYMFFDCNKLTSLNLSNFNSNYVKNMRSMFYNCRSLTSLNLSDFYTNNVKDMNEMFYGCLSLTSLNLSDFNTDNVKNMSGMFYKCSSLTSLNLSNFNTNNVKHMSGMFRDCSSLSSLNLSNFNTNNVNNMSCMFSGCYYLTSLNLSNFSTNNVNNMSFIFSNCRSLTSLNLSHFNTANVKDMSGMFYGCSSLTSLNLSNFNTNNVYNMSGMFRDCSSLTSLNLSNFNTNNVKDMNNMFCDCRSLTSLNLANFNTINVEYMENIFKNLNRKCEIISKDEKMISEKNK